MEEELNENELEERLYAMLHHVDQTQNNLSDSQQNKLDITQVTENVPRSSVRRYWRTGPENNHNPYQKLNTVRASNPAPPPATNTTAAPDETTTKAEKSPPKPPSPANLSIFQSPVPQNAKKIIEFLEFEEDKPVLLESSDEDEVVEVVLPPKPTITIESSDEDDLHISKTKSPTAADPKSSSGDRAISASPVPSVVSSVSDEFIRGDCIALNISSRHPDKHSFDFSLHGSDLLGQNTNALSKKKKRKKNKEAVTSTPIASVTENTANVADACFATPKSKARNKKQKSKLFTEKSDQNAEIDNYQLSDSNVFPIDLNKNRNPYIVTEKSLPSADVYESDSNQSEIVKEINTDQSKDKNVVEAYSSDSSDHIPAKISKSSKNDVSLPYLTAGTVDLTDNDHFVTIDDTGICDDSIVIGNVTGLSESMNDIEGSTPNGDISKYLSSKVPSILNEDLDFDNLKGKEKVCKKRRYSLTTLRAEMEKFYNESWGGEEFNHKEIQKNMSRDKSLWAIDPKDRMQSYAQRKSKCNYCNRYGHRDDTCRQRPPVCHMCGNAGHYEPRCPTKICVNCGAPNYMYSTMCRNCSGWVHMKCAECGQNGHPASHCPDLWRRYHNTISTGTSLEKCHQSKKYYQLHCSGCARKGHLVHTCRSTLPFSGLPINSPYVRFYRPIYTQSCPDKPVRSKSFSEDSTQRPEKNFNNKRQSKSPTVHETHLNKKRYISAGESDTPKSTAPQKYLPKEVNKEDNIPKNKSNQSLDSSATVTTSEKAPDFIPIGSSNHDNKGQVIQDNEVSDTSDVITSARIYVTNEIISKFKTKEGEEWLKATCAKLKVEVFLADVNLFLSIRGKVADQEVFQTELREWAQTNTNKPKNTSAEVTENDKSANLSNLPKNRNNLLRQLNKALESLKEDFGDPQALYRELTYFKIQHRKMMNQKVISPTKLSNNRTRINDMLKKLNMILLGQAGLADGSQHLNELISFKEKLMSSRQKNIPPSLREAIGEHYRCIFSPSARNDYSQLMKKYYLAKRPARVVNAPAKAKKKKKRTEGKTNTASVKPSIPSQDTNQSVVVTPETDQVAVRNDKCAENYETSIILREHLNKMINFSKQLRNMIKKRAYPKETKKDMELLMRKMHSFIDIIYQKKPITAKMLKKIRKAKTQAQMFLQM